jgi:hypothetical protein
LIDDSPDFVEGHANAATKTSKLQLSQMKASELEKKKEGSIVYGLVLNRLNSGRSGTEVNRSIRCQCSWNEGEGEMVSFNIL